MSNGAVLPRRWYKILQLNCYLTNVSWIVNHSATREHYCQNVFPLHISAELTALLLGVVSQPCNKAVCCRIFRSYNTLFLICFWLICLTVFRSTSCSVYSMTWILSKPRTSTMFHEFIPIDHSSVESLQHLLQDWTQFACHISYVFYSKRKVKSAAKNFIIRVASSEMQHVKISHLERLIWKMSIPVSIKQDLNSTGKWRLFEANEIA